MRIVLPRRKVVLWTLALLVAVVVGGVWFAYAYVTDSRTLAALIRAEAPRYLPGTHLDLGRVRVRPFAGEVNLTTSPSARRSTARTSRPSASPGCASATTPGRCSRGKFVPREVVVTHPTLRLCRRQDGTWNLQGLLADPWPGPTLADPPTISVQNGTVELCDDDPERGRRGDPPRRLAEARPGRRRDRSGSRGRPRGTPSTA